MTTSLPAHLPLSPRTFDLSSKPQLGSGCMWPVTHHRSRHLLRVLDREVSESEVRMVVIKLSHLPFNVLCSAKGCLI